MKKLLVLLFVGASLLACSENKKQPEVAPVDQSVTAPTEEEVIIINPDDSNSGTTVIDETTSSSSTTDTNTLLPAQ